MHTLDDNLRVRLLHILERSYIELAHLAMGQKFRNPRAHPSRREHSYSPKALALKTLSGK